MPRRKSATVVLVTQPRLDIIFVERAPVITVPGSHIGILVGQIGVSVVIL